MSDQPQHNTETRGCQETPILLIRDLPYLQDRNNHSVSQICFGTERIEKEQVLSTA